MTFFQTLLDTIKSLHDPATFSMWLSQGGVILVTAIIFAETGLLFGFFLPGDSLLITAGVLANPLNPNHVPGLSVITLAIFLTIAAIVGDQLGYFFGRKTGEMIYHRKDGVLFKKKHVVAAKAFYDRYGRFAIIGCRFVPIFRTFVPFIAGVAKMDYPTYLKTDIFGGFLWINSLLGLGYWLGQTPLANRLDKLVAIVILVSMIPMAVGALKKTFGGKSRAV